MLLLSFLGLLPATLAAQAPAPARSWETVSEQVMLLEDGLPALYDVMVTRNAIVVRFADTRADSVEHAVAVVARILNGSSEALYLTVSASQPARIAAAVTSGGFPPERIALTEASDGVTLQAIRLPPAVLSRSGPPSRP